MNDKQLELGFNPPRSVFPQLLTNTALNLLKQTIQAATPIFKPSIRPQWNRTLAAVWMALGRLKRQTNYHAVDAMLNCDVADPNHVF